MANKTTLPSRFLAHGTPGEGLVTIVDQETGKSGKIPLSSLPLASDLFENLFGSKITQEVEPEASPEPKDEEAATPKRKPGRPRKVVSSDSEETEVTPKRKPGRPKKTETLQAEAKIEETPKRKPGRPKKVEAEQAELEIEEKPKRKPGRPKKVEAEQAELDIEEKPKRKPGRPKKADSESTAAKEAAEKPKKVEQAPVSDVASSEDAEDIIVNEGFKLVRDKNLEGVVYDIILDDGEAIGILEMDDNGKNCTVRPGPKSSESETKHVSLNGALARIYVDWVIDL